MSFTDFNIGKEQRTEKRCCRQILAKIGEINEQSESGIDSFTIDLSDSGMALLTQVPIPVGRSVKIELEKGVSKTGKIANWQWDYRYGRKGVARLGVKLMEERDWGAQPLFRLIAYIINKHHYFTRQELERLEGLLLKARLMHEQNHPELSVVQQLFQDLNEVLLHTFKEEQILFPYIILMEEAVNNNKPIPAACFETVKMPIQMMTIEHEKTESLLREIRVITSNYSIPDDACISYEVLYQGLQELEQNLHQHMALENNILFPRAINMESGKTD